MLKYSRKSKRFYDTHTGRFVSKSRGLKSSSGRKSYRKKPLKPIEKTYKRKPIEKPIREIEVKEEMYSKKMIDRLKKIEDRYKYHDTDNRFLYSKEKKKYGKVKAYFVCHDDIQGDTAFDFVFHSTKDLMNKKQWFNYLLDVGVNVMNGRILEAMNVQFDRDWKVTDLLYFHEV